MGFIDVFKKAIELSRYFHRSYSYAPAVDKAVPLATQADGTVKTWSLANRLAAMEKHYAATLSVTDVEASITNAVWGFTYLSDVVLLNDGPDDILIRFNEATAPQFELKAGETIAMDNLKITAMYYVAKTAGGTATLRLLGDGFDAIVWATSAKATDW